MKINLKNKSLFINGGRPYRKKKWLNNVTTNHNNETTKIILSHPESNSIKYLIETIAYFKNIY